MVGSHEDSDRSARRYAGLLAVAGDTVVVVTSDGRCVEVHRAAHREGLWLPDGPCAGRDVRDLLGRHQGERLLATMARAVSSGRPATMDLDTVLPDGRSRTYELRCADAGDDNCVVVARDVTGDRTAERLLAERASWHRRLVAACASPLAVADAAGNFTELNDAACELLGRSRAELLSMGPMHVVHPADLPLVAHQGAAALRGDKLGRHQQVRIIRPDGEVRWVASSLALVEGPAGTASFFVGQFTDITDQKRAEASLEEARRQLATRADLLQAMTDTVHHATYLVDADGNMTFISDQWVALTGQPVAEALGTGWVAMVADEDRSEVVAAQRQVIATGSVDFRFRCRRTDGGLAWLEARCRKFRLHDDGTTLFVGTVSDVTASVTLEADRARLAAIVEASLDLVTLTDATGRLLFANSTARSMLGEGNGLPDRLTAASLARYEEEAVVAVHREGFWGGELELCLGDDLHLPLSVQMTAERSARGEVEAIATVARDIGELRRVNDELAYLANHDPLTRLPNRSLLVEALHRMLAPPAPAPFALMFVDLDGFKPVNDLHGHEAGDAVLVEVAERLRTSLRSGDLAARLGGDEFVVLCPGAGEAAIAEPIAARVLAHLGRPIIVGDRAVHVGASIGVAIVLGGTAEEALAAADAAMYRAKAAGRGRSCTVEVGTRPAGAPRAGAGR